MSCSVLQYNGTAQLHHTSITLGGLQPYTKYTARVRCGAAKNFWRWSEWSKTQTIRTKEAGMSVVLRREAWKMFFIWDLFVIFYYSAVLLKQRPLHTWEQKHTKQTLKRWLCKQLSSYALVFAISSTVDRGKSRWLGGWMDWVTLFCEG